MKIVIHHTVSSRDKTTVQDIDAWHKLRWPDFKGSLGYWVGYHYVITGDGSVKQTREDIETGAHCIPNVGKLGICLTGNFEIEEPSEKQLSSLQTLLIKLKSEYNISDNQIYGHRELSRTLCPGKTLMSWIEAYRKLSLVKKLLLLYKKLLELFLKGR